ncbi:MAG: hypothetical protein GY786_05265, partial [Proteobacteria bacterium]|nr:hypothetical protein [Pseudomonadota bacterium]
PALLPEKSDSTGSHTYGGCFPEGTRIVTADGSDSIENIEKGIFVKSFNPELQIFENREVKATQTHLFSGDLIHLTIESSTLSVTSNHPVLVAAGEDLSVRMKPDDLKTDDFNRLSAGRWVEAGDLRAGDSLLISNGTIKLIDSINTKIVSLLPVYNFEVDINNTYLAGKLGIVVHNKGQQESEESIISEGKYSDQEFFEPEESGARYFSNVARNNFFHFSELEFISAEDAYKTYIDKREKNGISSGLIVEAALWFYKNMEFSISVRIL